MTRKYLNDRWCVRCGKKDPTPYLKKNMKLFPKSGKVLDIGCGNGRNSKFMSDNGYDVTSLDMAGDFGIKMILGVDDFPDGKFDIVLANYVLMFLNDQERQKVMEDIISVSKSGTVLMIEMYPAKDAHSYDFDEMVSFFVDCGWKKVRKSKDKCVLEWRVNQQGVEPVWRTGRTERYGVQVLCSLPL